ncbi:DNA mismatch repair protein MutT, partial [Bacillus cereus]
EVELHELPASGTDQYILEEEGRTYLFRWVPVEELHTYDLQPAFIKEKVKDVSVHTEHIVLQK